MSRQFLTGYFLKSVVYFNKESHKMRAVPYVSMPLS